MKKHIIRLLTLACLAGTAFSCKKDYDTFSPLAQNRADIPVTFPNQTFFEFVPIITTSVGGGGKVEIKMQIPADKGQIKEISRVATGANGRRDLFVTSTTGAFNYSTASSSLKPIPGNNTNEITFSTTLAEYTTYRARVGTGAGPVAAVAMTTATPTAPAVVNERAPTQLQFFFILTLADGSQIVPTEVRVRILP